MNWYNKINQSIAENLQVQIRMKKKYNAILMLQYGD